MAKTVIGVFKTQDNAEAAVNELHILGYDTKYISLLMKDLRKVSAIKSKGGQVISDAARDAATGAVAGGLQGILIALGIPENEAKKYEEYIRAGGILLIVPTRNLREDEVQRILSDYSAFDIKVLDLPTDIKDLHKMKKTDKRVYARDDLYDYDLSHVR